MRADAIEAARQFVGVPFKHQGRNPAVGVDCVGLGVLYLRALGFDVIDRTDYSRDPDGTLRRELTRVLGEPVGEGAGCWRLAEPGDVLSLRFANLGHVPERHVGIACRLYGKPALIHADNSPTIFKVCEHPMDRTWQRRVVGVWRVA